MESMDFEAAAIKYGPKLGNANVGIISWEQKNVVIKKIVPATKLKKTLRVESRYFGASGNQLRLK